MVKGADSQAGKEILQRYANHVQTLVDELDDIMSFMHKSEGSNKHKATIMRFK